MPNSCGGRVVRCAGTRSVQRSLIVIIVLFAGMWGPGAVWVTRVSGQEPGSSRDRRTASPGNNQPAIDTEDGSDVRVDGQAGAESR